MDVCSWVSPVVSFGFVLILIGIGITAFKIPNTKKLTKITIPLGMSFVLAGLIYWFICYI